MSDDLSMKALSGNMHQRTQAVLGAGSDLALHCNGDLAEMREVAAAHGHQALTRVCKLGGHGATVLAAAIHMIRAEQKSGDFRRDRERWAGPVATHVLVGWNASREATRARGVSGPRARIRALFRGAAPA